MLHAYFLTDPTLFPPFLYRACAGIPAVVSGGGETLSSLDNSRSDDSTVVGLASDWT